jgi:iron complex transport system substrate-binding protein
MKQQKRRQLIQNLGILGIAVFILCMANITRIYAAPETITITDGWKRQMTVPKHPEHVLCSGPGCLRYFTYLQAQDKIVAVDDIETGREMFYARPYALANPQFKNYPTFGEFRGHDNPELIIGLEPQPQVIFKTYGEMGHDPEELQQKTGIPVIVLEYGDLSRHREQIYQSLRIMAEVMGKEERAEAIIDFFEAAIQDLDQRTRDVPEEQKISCFLGGVAYKGPHGLQSTEPTYPPFLFIHSKNVAYDPAQADQNVTHADVAKEKIIVWDPEIIFVDLSTIQSDSEATALYELRHDPAYQHLRAVQTGNICGVLPYNWYTQNMGSILANAYFVGKLLYPDQFTDIDPKQKADEIYQFLLGKPVFELLNQAFGGFVFTKLSLDAE